MGYQPQDRPGDGELLYGCKAIGAHLGLTAAETWTLCSKDELPHFRIGRRLCARRKILDRWLEKLQPEEPDHAA